MRYPTVDQEVAHILELQPGALLAKVDVAHAFRNISQYVLRKISQTFTEFRDGKPRISAENSGTCDMYCTCTFYRAEGDETFEGDTADSVTVMPCKTCTVKATHTHTHTYIQTRPHVLAPTRFKCSLHAHLDFIHIVGRRPLPPSTISGD